MSEPLAAAATPAEWLLARHDRAVELRGEMDRLERALRRAPSTRAEQLLDRCSEIGAELWHLGHSSDPPSPVWEVTSTAWSPTPTPDTGGTR